MEIFLGNELGYLCEKDCQMIKSIMDGATYYNFRVSWTNNAGNCQLLIETDYESTKEEAKSMFLHAYFSETAEIAKWQKILARFCQMKQDRPEGLVVFGCGNYFSCFFQDADYLEQLNIPSLNVGKNVLGYKYASIQKEKIAELIEALQAEGKEGYMAEIEVI